MAVPLSNKEQTFFNKICFYKIGRTSANNGPIWKIRNLARSGLRRRHVGRHSDVARDATRVMTSHAWWRHARAWRLLPSYWDSFANNVQFLTFCCHPCCQGLALKPWDGFCSFLVGRLIWLIWADTQKFNNLDPISWPWHHFLIYMITAWLPWKPMA